MSGKRKRGGLWDRISSWIKANEKVLTVMVLALLAVTFAFPQFWTPFSKMSGEVVEARVMGRNLTRADLESALRKLEIAFALDNRLRYETPLTLGAREAGREQALDFLVYVEKAKELGLRVTDAELGAKRREAWRIQAAQEQAFSARAELLASGISDRQAAQSAFTQKYSEVLQDLNDRNVFDPKDWYRIAASNRYRLPVMVVEEALREVMLVAKLEAFVTSTVQVSSEEVYEEYKKTEQRRRASWVEVQPPPELREKIAASITEADLREEFESNLSVFRLPLTMSCDYLFLPEEHFKEEAEGKVNEETLRKEFDDDRHLYRKADIRSDDAAFVLRTPEESRALETEVYKSYEEVKDEVRNKWVDEETKRLLSDFERRIRIRLFPSEPPASGNETLGGKASTVAELSQEFPFLVSGSVKNAARLEIEDVLGDYYSPTVMSWFSTAEREGDMNEAQRTKLTQANAVTGGRVFYVNVAFAPAHDPSFEEIQDKVLETLIKKRLTDLLAQAADSQLEKLKDENVAFSELAGDDVSVEEGDVKATVKLSALSTSSEYIRERGTLMVPLKENSGDTSKPSDSNDDSVAEWPPKLEAHESSSAIVQTLFEAENKGAVLIARDESKGRCYLVRYDDVVYPAPDRFPIYRSMLENRVLREKQDVYFAEWRADVYNQAYGAPREVPEVEVQS